GIVGEHLEELEARVRQTREAQHDSARQARVEHLRLHTRAVRQLVRYLRAEGETLFHPEGEP
ncbi:F0F1 ATP synthase subunit epsilon, partial [Azotobacter beijerinckii]|nr:F0F1 ATP synthase subunit epsilon [Azotobacter beijerinckii]